MVASISSSTVSQWSDALFSKLDTKNQGFVDKAQIQAAFKASGSGATTTADSEAAEQLFNALDVDGDSKVTKSELSSAIDKLASALNAQLDQTRVAQGSQGARPAGPPTGGGAGGPPPSGNADDTESYVAAADLDGDGSVSAEEAAAYAKQLAAGEADTGLSKQALTEQLGKTTDARQASALSKLVDNFDKADADSDGKLTREEGHDYLESTRPARPGSEDSAANGLARALQMLKAYVDSEANTAILNTSA
jgi:Ca2+-binding EF-hand superfamily protein